MKPQQFFTNSGETNLLGRDDGESFAEVVASLESEEAPRPDAGSILPRLALVQYLTNDAEVLLHGNTYRIVPPDDVRRSFSCLRDMSSQSGSSFFPKSPCLRGS